MHTQERTRFFCSVQSRPSIASSRKLHARASSEKWRAPTTGESAVYTDDIRTAVKLLQEKLIEITFLGGEGGREGGREK